MRGWGREAVKERKSENIKRVRKKSLLCVMDTLFSEESLCVSNLEMKARFDEVLGDASPLPVWPKIMSPSWK